MLTHPVTFFKEVGVRITYLLRTAFELAATDPITLSDNTTYTDSEDWIIDGSFLTNIPSGASFTVTGDALDEVQPTTPVATDVFGLRYPSGITAQDGQAFKMRTIVDLASIADRSTLVLKGTQDWALADTSRFWIEAYNNDSILYIQTIDASSGIIEAGAASDNESYEFALVLSTTKCFYYVKGGVFTDWNLIYVSTDVPTSTIYPYVYGYKGDHSVEYVAIPETLFPDLATTALYDDWISGGSNPMTDAAFDALDTI